MACQEYLIRQQADMEAAATVQQPKALGDVADIVMGQSPPGSTVSPDHGIPLLNGPTEFGSHHPTPAQYTSDARKLAQPGDLLFYVRGSTTGRMNWADREYAIGRGVAAIRHRNESMLQPLIRGVIEVELPELLTQATGSTFPNVSAKQLAEIPYPTFSETEQRAIAHILGTLDDKIELNRRMNQTLEEMARALFKSWFVDFDPVRAKAALKHHALMHHAGPDSGSSDNGALSADEWTVERARAYLDAMAPEVTDLFPDRLVPSELGEIPEGWEAKGLGEVVELNPRESMKGGTIAPYLDMAALPTSGPSPNEAVLRRFKSGTRFRNGDTLFARITPCLENGKTAFIQSMPPSAVGWGSTEFIVMRAKPPVPPVYTYLLARDPTFRAHAIQNMTGTSGRQRARTEALAPYPLPSCPRAVWMGFRSLAEPLFDKIEMNRRKAHALAAQRDVLLPKLMSGEVCVSRSLESQLPSTSTQVS